MSQYPLCCPARATLLTGQQAHNHHVLGNEPPLGGYGRFDESSTLPIWLQDAGYRTAMVGKYLNGYPVAGEETHVAPGWDEWHVPVRGIYDYRDYTVNHNGRLTRHRQYQTDWTAKKVTGLIRDFAEHDDPYFLWAGFLAPHFGGPVEADDAEALGNPNALPTPNVADRYRDTDTTEIPDHPNVDEADLSDKGTLIRNHGPLDHDQLTEQIRQRRETLRSVDDAVSAIVDAVRKTGELDNTVLVFTSDNGFLLGEHGMRQKVFGYEESIRVPLLMAGPHIEEGVRRRQLVSLTDLPATFVDLADAEAGVLQDGRSLVPLSQDPEEGDNRHLLLEAGGAPFTEADRLYTGVRTAQGKVVLRWWDGWIETYDLRTDPYQLDGTTSPDEERWRDRLLAELDRLETCAGERECSG